MKVPRFLFSPKWILFHLLCLGGIVLMLNLSAWQWNRLQERRDFNAVVEDRIDQDVVLLDELVPAGATAEQAAAAEWRPAQASGVYLTAESFLVVNRSQDGRAGSNLVTPMELGDGRVLLVNRGFLPLDAEVPLPPTGRVTVAGILRDSEARRFGQLTSSDTAADDGVLEVPRIDIESLSEELGTDLVPVYLEEQVSQPADSDELSIVAPPELSEGSHLSYAIQWIIFSICVAVGWVFAVRRSIRTHRAAAAAAGDDPPSGGEEAPDGTQVAAGQDTTH